jgi:hypothetical protein
MDLCQDRTCGFETKTLYRTVGRDLRLLLFMAMALNVNCHA